MKLAGQGQAESIDNRSQCASAQVYSEVAFQKENVKFFIIKTESYEGQN